ncbi:amidohydrolase family protein [soil metagenome]
MQRSDHAIDRQSLTVAGSVAQDFDIVIRDGLIVDGNGSAPYPADLAIRGGKIAEIGTVRGQGRTELDAKGCIVTPGFIDVHTHYDGQAIWSGRFDPSSFHGVTTVVIGNCGVGFAPCRAEDRDLLINTMEGVEDIPEVVMTEGLDWSWETFEQFLDALEATPHDIDVAAYLPHSALRIYVMGNRGGMGVAADCDELDQMNTLVRRALEHGAVGFSSSRFSLHRRGDGEKIPSFDADERELAAAARAIAEVGHGIMQIIPDSIQDEETARAEIDMFARLSEIAGAPVTFTLLQSNSSPGRWRHVLDWVDAYNADGVRRLRPQIFPRPLGMLMGHRLSLNPFSRCPQYRALDDLPFSAKLDQLRKPSVRAAILSDSPEDPDHPLVQFSRDFEHIYQLGNSPDYEPDPSMCIASLAKAKGMEDLALAYDLLLEDEGRALLMMAAANFANGSLDHVAVLAAHPDTVIGLGDGGAHYGFICDSSYPTTVLTHWLRREGQRLSVPDAIRTLTSAPADLLGFADRGRLRRGLKADINILDLAKLEMKAPEVCHDLPSGGRRLTQQASGYRATIVAGEVIMEEGVPTGILPGRLVRSKTRNLPTA